MLALIKRLYIERVGYIKKIFLLNLLAINGIIISLYMINSGKLSGREMMEIVFGFGISSVIGTSLLLIIRQNFVWYKARYRLIPLKDWQLFMVNLIATFLLVCSNVGLFYLLLGFENVGLSLIGKKVYSVRWLIENIPTSGWFYLGFLYIILFIVLCVFLLFLLSYIISKTYIPPRAQGVSIGILFVVLYKLYNWIVSSQTLSFELSNRSLSVATNVLILACMCGFAIILLSRVEVRE
ncbi:hypothetical protein [Vagococcus zengguangii]|uniref:Uncharacterized protein n=1 Tax=Vagococcus zengguangii TaxID=2571750 RepID=A0A4D7CSE1_9ENTE|nr:hypothetical protein [Vagococcus zengguangii]QCI85804.1 hypothetical protein FA707_01965 [Vagococcus zengguangii]TLG81745.1 hypothetical protein FE258_00945 [Vagococcus zengguangii]